MKPLLTLILCFCSFISFSQDPADSKDLTIWKLSARNTKDGQSWSYETVTLKRADSVVILNVLMQIDSAKVQQFRNDLIKEVKKKNIEIKGYEEFHHGIYSFEINCVTNKYKIRSFSAYSAGSKILTIGYPNTAAPVVPQFVSEGVMRNVCQDVKLYRL